MPGLGALWDSLVDCICRPPRDEYVYPDELVGGSRRLFRVGKYSGIREDLTLTNKRGLLLHCSHYIPKHVQGKDGRLPCVVYCHCNSGSRRDAEEAICVLIPCGVSVFTLDFAGSGLSEGQWVTLGAEEVDDVASAVEHLRSGGRVSTVGLWGRSMGAVTALLYSHKDPSIAGMVLDSPFARLTDLMMEIVQEQRLPIPRALAKLALAAMKRSVMKRAGFDIAKVSPVDVVVHSHIPALFGHATGDTFIRISHSEALYGAYAGDKDFIRFDGDHNSRRPDFFYSSVSNFWNRALLLEHLLEPADPVAALGPGALSVTGWPGRGGISGTARSGPGRALRPPPPQLQHSQPNPALTAAAGGDGINKLSASGAELPKALAAPPADDAADGGSVAAGVGGIRAEERLCDEDGVDVAGLSSRSAPWEPRLWDVDADRAELERQRFRRMAGGLNSPPRPSTATAADGERPSRAGAAASGNSRTAGVSFRSSSDVAQLFATTSDDESLAARLLGQESQWSDGALMGLEPRSCTASASAAVAPNGHLIGGRMASALLLPASLEEEEAQLREALEQSLMEAARKGVPPAARLAAAAAAAAAGRAPEWEHNCWVQPGVAVKVGAAHPSSGGGVGTGLEGGEAQASSPASVGGAPAAVALPLLSVSPPSSVVPLSGLLAFDAAGSAAVAVAQVAGPDTSTAGAQLTGRSLSHDDGRTHFPLLAAMPSVSLSSPSESALQHSWGGSAAAVSAAAGFVLPCKPRSLTLDNRTATAGIGYFPGADAAAVAGSGGDALSVRGPSDGAKPQAMHWVSPVAVCDAAATPMAQLATGLTVYDLCTEEELLALAIQLSLREGAGATSARAASTSGDAAASTAGGLPSLL